MILVDIVSEITLLVLTSDTMATLEKNGWDISCILLGTTGLVGIAWGTVSGMFLMFDSASIALTKLTIVSCASSNDYVS